MENSGNPVILRKLSVPETKLRLRNILKRRLSEASQSSERNNPVVSRQNTCIAFNMRHSVAIMEETVTTRNSELQSEDNEIADPDVKLVNRWTFKTLFLFLMLTSAFLHFAALLFSCSKVDKPIQDIYKLDDLFADLNDIVYGQSLAINIIINELKDFQYSSQSVLVLHLIGSTGTGKTLVARVLSKHFLRYGTNVNWYVSTELPSTEWLISKITFWFTNVFILDDIQVDESDLIRTIEHFRKSVYSSYAYFNSDIKFVFLITNNQRASTIIDVSAKAMNSGVPRDQLTLEHFPFLNKDEGSDSRVEDEVIKYSFIPFLPLTKVYVLKCIKQIIDSFENQSAYSTEYVSTVLSSISYIPLDNPVFSKLGCKKIPLL